MLFRFTQTGEVVFTDGMAADVQKSDANAAGCSHVYWRVLTSSTFSFELLSVVDQCATFTTFLPPGYDLRRRRPCRDLQTINAHMLVKDFKR